MIVAADRLPHAWDASEARAAGLHLPLVPEYLNAIRPPGDRREPGRRPCRDLFGRDSRASLDRLAARTFSGSCFPVQLLFLTARISREPLDMFQRFRDARTSQPLDSG